MDVRSRKDRDRFASRVFWLDSSKLDNADIADAGGEEAVVPFVDFALGWRDGDRWSDSDLVGSTEARGEFCCCGGVGLALSSSALLLGVYENARRHCKDRWECGIGSERIVGDDCAQRRFNIVLLIIWYWHRLNHTKIGMQLLLRSRQKSCALPANSEPNDVGENDLETDTDHHFATKNFTVQIFCYFLVHCRLSSS